MSNWQIIYQSKQAHKVEIVKAFLQDNGLNPIIFNKTDTPYAILGEYEVRVKPEEVLEAIQLIKEHIRFE